MPDIEWDSSGIYGDQSPGVIVPVLETPLNELEMENLKRSIDPTAPSPCYGMDIYMATAECVQRIINVR